MVFHWYCHCFDVANLNLVSLGRVHFCSFSVCLWIFPRLLFVLIVFAIFMFSALMISSYFFLRFNHLFSEYWFNSMPLPMLPLKSMIPFLATRLTIANWCMPPIKWHRCLINQSNPCSFDIMYITADLWFGNDRFNQLPSFLDQTSKCSTVSGSVSYMYTPLRV